MSDSLILKVYTVDRQLEAGGCDSVVLNIAEDEKGRFSGSYGIKRGHAKAVFSLAEGVITAKKKGDVIFSAKVSEGFATVENDVVSVTVDRVKEVNK